MCHSVLHNSSTNGSRSLVPNIFTIDFYRFGRLIVLLLKLQVSSRRCTLSKSKSSPTTKAGSNPDVIIQMALMEMANTEGRKEGKKKEKLKKKKTWQIPELFIHALNDPPAYFKGSSYNLKNCTHFNGSHSEWSQASNHNGGLFTLWKSCRISLQSEKTNGNVFSSRLTSDKSVTS